MRPSEAKFCFFGHYWWILPVAFVVVASIIVGFGPGWDWTLLGGLAGAVLSVAYFVHSQRLGEIQFFLEIFRDSNKRYDRLNSRLMAIMQGAVAQPLEARDMGVLMDYFNLCAEEYLYYKKGYILPEVWRAWVSGMQQVFAHPRIAELWRTEDHGSYYGFSPCLCAAEQTNAVDERERASVNCCGVWHHQRALRSTAFGAPARN